MENIKEKAKQFAVDAHKNQHRKIDKDKPTVIHPCGVATILDFYGYDDNLVAAGYLHDIVEDTKYTLEDITNNFGEDVAYLVNSVTVPRTIKNWEDKKKYTINNCPNMDYRVKALELADKINNIEDLAISFARDNKFDFSNFSRDFDSQKWYYTSFYNAIVDDNKKNALLFRRLRKSINALFKEKNPYMLFIPNYEYIKSLYKDNEYFNTLKVIEAKKMELLKIKELYDSASSFKMEIIGPRNSGKTCASKVIKDFFSSSGLVTEIVSDSYPFSYNITNPNHYIEIMRYIMSDIDVSISDPADIILYDGGLYNRIIWLMECCDKDLIDKNEVDIYIKKALLYYKKMMNLTLNIDTTPKDSIIREYNKGVSLKRCLIDEDEILNYQKNYKLLSSIVNIEDKNYENILNDDRDINMFYSETCDKVLRNVRKHYLDEFKKSL